MPIIPQFGDPSQALADIARVRQQRFVDQATGSGQARMVGGPAPDPAWDAFYGAMQRKDEIADSGGMQFHAAMPVGGARGTGTRAFGQRMARMNADDPNDALKGLMRQAAIRSLQG